MLRTIAPLLLAVVVSACADEAPTNPDASVPSACTGCAADQVCDEASATCVQGLTEGQACTDATGAGVPGAACATGLTCGRVGVSDALDRCAKACTARNAGEVCPLGSKCFARPGGDTTNGFCGTESQEDDTCDIAQLKVCPGGLTCITPNASVTAGMCLKTCDPLAPSCAANKACANPFPSDPTRGLCVVPAGHFPDKCDYTALKFCGTGELCARPTSDNWGYCHLRCTSDAECTGATGKCVEPVEGVRFCAVPAATDAHCDAAEDKYCARTDICVKVSTDTLCKVDCTNAGVTCPANTTCSVLTGSTRKACL